MKNFQTTFQPLLVILTLAIVSPTEGDNTLIVSSFTTSSDFDITIIADANTKIESNGNTIEYTPRSIPTFNKPVDNAHRYF